MAKSKRNGTHNPALKTPLAGEEEPFDVFLSHNSKNKPIVKELATELKKRGLKVWLDEWELIPGRPWQEAIEEIIQNTTTAAVLVGKDGMGPWEIPEMRACLSEFVNRKLPVIPVLLPGAPDEIELPLFLKLFTWVDLRKGFTKDGFDRLEWGITGERPADEQEAKLLLQIHNLPYRSIGGIFKGRDKILARLKKQLGGDKPMAITQGIQGLGGIGKTRLAVEFGWWALENKKYDRVFFVNSETPEKLRNSLASLAGEKMLGLAGRKEDEQIASVTKWFMGNSKWLMILDNADTEDAANAVEDFLPSLANGSVIITSRYARWSGSVSSQHLGLLEPQEAKQFLLERTAAHRIKTGSDEEIAEKLAKELGYLPLALEQTAAYIAHNKCSLAEYIEEWENERQKVLEWYDKRQMQYDVSVAVTWRRTFDQLEPSARAFLRLAAFLAPEMIPTDMFQEGIEFMNEATELQCKEMNVKKVEFKLKEALSELAAYSMITRQQKGFTVHRIVQEVIRSRIPESDQKSWLELALEVVNNFAPSGSDDVRAWPILDVLRPHAELIAGTADLAKITEPTSRLMNELGSYLYTKGLYHKAEQWMQRSLEIDESTFGPDHPEVAIDLNNLAQLLMATNRLEETEPLMRRALKIDETSFGPDHPRVAVRLNNLALLLKTTNRLDEAEPMYRRALEIDESSFGPDHPRVAIRLNNLAQLFVDTNRLDQAELSMRRALKIDENSFSPDHPKIAIRLNNLAQLFADTNRLDEAEPLMRRGLEIEEKSKGKDHPHVAIQLNNLAQLLKDTNRLDEARPLMERALKIFEDSLGHDHPNTQTVRDNLKYLK